VRDFGGDGGDFWAGGGGGVWESRRVGIDISARTVPSVSNSACKQTNSFPAHLHSIGFVYQIVSFFFHRKLRIRFCILLKKKPADFFKILC